VATNRICYPGVSSCITVTAPLAGGILGAHITVGTPQSEIDTMFTAIRTGGGGNCPVIYVAGRIATFKVQTLAPAMNTRKKIAARIKSMINAAATVRFYDTTALGATHIFAERNGAATSFFWIAEHGNNVAGFIYPNFAGRTAIPLASFIVR
jgi:hypothetical protein